MADTEGDIRREVHQFWISQIAKNHSPLGKGLRFYLKPISGNMMFGPEIPWTAPFGLEFN